MADMNNEATSNSKRSRDMTRYDYQNRGRTRNRSGSHDRAVEPRVTRERRPRDEVRSSRESRPRYERQTARDAVTREEERRARRVQRAPRKKPRSIGADALSLPASTAIGLTPSGRIRPQGRGETARRVEAQRTDSFDVRPAIYTEKHPRINARMRRPGFIFAAPSIRVWRSTLVLLVVVAMLIVALMGPARDYYAAWREAGILQVEYEAVAAQNAELNHNLERLQSLEGIEDEARLKGYVYPDEEALVVEGLDEGKSATDPKLVEAAVAEHEANLPWYVRMLDSLLGYSHE